MDTPTQYRYEQLAELIVGMIDKGALAPGMRLPSVRAVSEQHRISISTALQAYRLLEDRGVLVARPQSGFYVAAARRGALALPSASRPRARASTVSISSAVAALLEHASNSKLVPLGCAVPDAALLQSKRLDLALARAARQHGTRYNTYGAPQGDPRLRREIAKRAMRVGHALSPDDVLVTCGCTEALTLALAAVARRGDTIAIESPTYFGFLHTIEMLGLKAFELPTHPTRGVDVGALTRLLETEPVAACLLSSSFNNPLGSMMAEADKRALLAVLARHAVPLIEDDVYGDIHFGRERPKPFIALDGGANTIYCSSFSKTVAPGYRIGWIIAGRHLPRVLDAKAAFTLCGSVLPQAAFAEFLGSGGYDQHLRRIRRIFADNIERMTRAIDKYFPSGTRVSRPAGGFVLWLEFPAAMKTRELFKKALDQGVCFAPGDVFSVSGRFSNCLRISCGHSWDARIERGVARLGALTAEALVKSSK